MQYQKSHLLKSLPISSEKYLCIEKLSSSQWWIQDFTNSNILLNAWILLLTTNIVSYVPWGDRLTSLIGLMCCQISNSENPNSSSQFSGRKKWQIQLAAQAAVKESINAQHFIHPQTSSRTQTSLQVSTKVPKSLFNGSAIRAIRPMDVFSSQEK